MSKRRWMPKYVIAKADGTRELGLTTPNEEVAIKAWAAMTAVLEHGETSAPNSWEFVSMEQTSPGVWVAHVALPPLWDGTIIEYTGVTARQQKVVS